MKGLVIVLAFLLSFKAALAQEHQSGQLTIQSAWSRATPPASEVAAGFLTIVNKGPDSDKLLSVASTLAQSVELHESTVVDGIARMRRVDALPLPPGETVVFKPGGLHLMFLKPSTRLRQGDRFDAKLTFEKAPPVTVTFEVASMGASAPQSSRHGQH